MKWASAVEKSLFEGIVYRQLFVDPGLQHLIERMVRPGQDLVKEPESLLLVRRQGLDPDVKPGESVFPFRVLDAEPESRFAVAEKRVLRIDLGGKERGQQDAAATARVLGLRRPPREYARAPSGTAEGRYRNRQARREMAVGENMTAGRRQDRSMPRTRTPRRASLRGSVFRTACQMRKTSPAARSAPRSWKALFRKTWREIDGQAQPEGPARPPAVKPDRRQEIQNASSGIPDRCSAQGVPPERNPGDESQGIRPEPEEKARRIRLPPWRIRRYIRGRKTTFSLHRSPRK